MKGLEETLVFIRDVVKPRLVARKVAPSTKIECAVIHGNDDLQKMLLVDRLNASGLFGNLGNCTRAKCQAAVFPW